MCSWRRSLKLYGQLSQCCDYIDAEHRAAAAAKGRTPTGWRYLHLVLTLRNCASYGLSDLLDQLQEAFTRLQRTKAYKDAIQGAYRSIEITRNLNREDPNYLTWHPHMHVLLVVHPSYLERHHKYITHEEWMQLWKRSARVPYDPWVYVSAVPTVDTISKATANAKRRKDPSVTADMGDALAEVTKYLCKSDWWRIEDITSNDPELSRDAGRAINTDVVALYTATDKRKMVSWYGVLRDAHRALHLDDEDGNLAQLSPIRPDVAYTLSHAIWRGASYIRTGMNTTDDSPEDIWLLASTMAIERGINPSDIQHMSYEDRAKIVDAAHLEAIRKLPPEQLAPDHWAKYRKEFVSNDQNL